MFQRQYSPVQLKQSYVDYITMRNVQATDDCFSYKHFYVLYCKFWTLDCDHDLVISEYDLARYDHTAMVPRIIRRVIQCGHISAFDQDQHDDPLTLTYLDYICNYLVYEQEKRQKFYGVPEDDRIRFEDVMCQMNDLIQPTKPGQFLLHDLKQNGYTAERFFDTFVNFDRFQLHEAYQGSIRANREKRKMTGIADSLDEAIGYCMFSNWCEYAELEYQQLQQNDRYHITWDEEEEYGLEKVEAKEKIHVQRKKGIEKKTERFVNDRVKTEHGEKQTDEEQEEINEEDKGEEEKKKKGKGVKGDDEESLDENKGTESASDHESDSSIPTTPTSLIKDSTIPAWDISKGQRKPWLWQLEDEEESEEESESWAAEWVWRLSRRQLASP
ncbi:Serine/threonine-protein phosphatase 2A regulatory subunit B'' subunit alpha [Apophysomyces sp. BC1034]|nr:Serine/threonine-protein phosphatase 2A regulatory subunit B'' subunit alpha [Apophysomyces sp. BC1034]